MELHVIHEHCEPLKIHKNVEDEIIIQKDDVIYN